MNSSQFGKIGSAKVSTLNRYFVREGPLMVVRETLRFIQGNFERQGWQGEVFVPWKKNKKGLVPILHRSGDLQGGFNYTLEGNGDVLFYNNIPYAKVHNEGFNGLVNIPAHIRGKFEKTAIYNVKSHRPRQIKAQVGKSKVIAHTRRMNIVQRQFAPYEGHESTVLNEKITKELEIEIGNILKF